MNKRAINYLSVAGLIILSLFLLSSIVQAEVTASGSWEVELTEEDFTIGSTFRLIDVKESSESEATISVSDDSLIPIWSVYVKRVDENWPQGVDLYVKRTGKGEDGGKIFGGEEYTLVGSSQSYFFAGVAKNINSIPLQFKVEGLTSISQPQTLTTTVEYSLSD